MYHDEVNAVYPHFLTELKLSINVLYTPKHIHPWTLNSAEGPQEKI